MKKILSMEGISKSYGNVKVLNKVNFDLYEGEIHALIGENGAGKSTLMNILTGAISKDEGSIYYLDKKVDNMSPALSKELGIAFVQQEFNLAESLSVSENVYMNRLPYKNEKLKIIDYKKLYKDTQYWLNILDANFKPTDLVGNLTTGQKQMVEIAKALSLDAKIIIFDEPTTALTNYEIDVLFVVINALKDKGIASIYISHRLNELFEISDRITVLRDGSYIGTDKTEDSTEDDLIFKMVGRPANQLYSKSTFDIGKVHIEAKNLSDTKGKVKDVSFKVREGEVVGFAGLVGSGRTESIRLLFGADKKGSGEIFIDGEKVDIQRPSEAVKRKISLIPEDRKLQGLALNLSIDENVNMAKSHSFILNKKEQVTNTKKYIDSLRIKTTGPSQVVGRLSGGNQQKVVVSKWLTTDGDIYLFDEPTKGIDVGAKSEIYEIIEDLAKKGKTIIIVSSEIQELLSITDRIYVFSEGVTTGELRTSDTDQEEIMKYATMLVEKNKKELIDAGK